jgi:hypothetical protein
MAAEEARWNSVFARCNPGDTFAAVQTPWRCQSMERIGRGFAVPERKSRRELLLRTRRSTLCAKTAVTKRRGFTHPSQLFWKLARMESVRACFFCFVRVEVSLPRGLTVFWRAMTGFMVPTKSCLLATVGDTITNLIARGLLYSWYW